MSTNIMTSLRTPMLGLFALALSCLGSCQTPKLEHAAWSQMGEGSRSVGASTGWAFYEAEMAANGLSGALTGATGTDNVDLAARYGGALKGQYYLSDNFSLGAIIELRSFDPDVASPLSADFIADDFETLHWLISTRYYLEPMGSELRWRPFVGLDYAYIDEVDFGSVTVDYGGAPSNEVVDIVAGSYTTIAPVIGASYLWNDKATLDFGGFYEFTDRAAKKTVAFTNLGGATAEITVKPEGLVLFAGMSFYF